MHSPVLRYVSAFLHYPCTWGALLLLALAHSSFAWWFAPSPLVQTIAIGLDAGCVVLFVAMTRSSLAFAHFYEQRHYQAAIHTIATRLPAGTETFRTAALACLTLSQQLHRDFKDEPSLHAFDEFLQNIITMADNHRTLFVRSQQFGTAAQQERMRALLARQVQAMQQTLENLQAFSGHLTIMSAQLEKTALAARELHFINQGLQEVIQEMADA